MNANTTTQGAAGASAGAALALVTLIIWGLSLVNVAVPSDVATAMVTLMTVGTHFIVTRYTPKSSVNIPVETKGAPVVVPVETKPIPGITS